MRATNIRDGNALLMLDEEQTPITGINDANLANRKIIAFGNPDPRH